MIPDQDASIRNPLSEGGKVRARTIDRILAELHVLVGKTSVKPVPLVQWRDEVLEAWASRAPTTRYRMRQALAELLEVVGPDGTTADVSPSILARFATRPGASSTTNGLLSSLRAALRFGIRRGYVDPKALEGTRWRIPAREATKRRHHGRAEVAGVLELLADGTETWEGGRLYTLACLYAYAGLRRNEALYLKVEDVDLVRGILFVRPNGRSLKTAGSAAPVPCPKKLLEVLRSWLARCGSEWVIPNRNRRGPWTGGTAGRRAGDRLKAAGVAAGVEGFTPQSLRHSLATHLAGWWGLGPKQIRMVLRHSNEQTQEHYVHPDLVNLVDQVRAFDYAPPGRPARPGPRPRRRILPRRRRRRR